MVDRSPEERLETLESQREEFELLKIEIKQTLVDLKEAIIKDGAIFPAVAREPKRATQQPVSAINQQPVSAIHQQPVSAIHQQPAFNGGRSPVLYEQPWEPPPPARSPYMLPLAEENREATHLPDPHSDDQNGLHPSGNLDVKMMGNIIWWLGTVKRRGLTLQLLTPLLEAYEMSGNLSPIMSKMILRSMADLDNLETDVTRNEFSSQDYADCLLQLHDIICTPGYVVDRMVPQIPAIDQDEAATGLAPQQTNQKKRTASSK